MTINATTLYTTWPTAESARSCAEAILAEKLAACANIIPGALSVFRWRGHVERAEEAIMFVKTSAAKASACANRISELHPYETPCVTALTIVAEGSHAPFVDWIMAETDADDA